jgi:hypothetical protein
MLHGTSNFKCKLGQWSKMLTKYRAEAMKEVFTKKVIEELRTQYSLLLVVDQSNNNSQPRKKERK